MLSDLHCALRSLRQAPRYTLLAVVIIALGTGACSAVYSLFQSLMLQPRVGLADETRLVDIGRTQNGSGFDNFSHPDLQDYRSRSSSFTDIAGLDFSPTPAGITVGSETQNAALGWVTPNFFNVLGTRFATGRGFNETETAESTIVISHRYWERRFDSDPGIVGRTVLLNGHPVTVSGVTEPGFNGTTILQTDLWAPLPLVETLIPGTTLLTGRVNSFLMGIGRLQPGVTPAQAQADLSVVARHLASVYPDSHRLRGVAVAPSRRFPGELGLMTGAFLSILGLLALLTFLVASANIAGLMLARGASRQREFALRSALGAGRSRLVRQLLAEHLALFALGGGTGCLVGLWLVDLFRHLVPQLPVSLELDVTVHPAAFAFTLGFALLVGVVFSLGPALSSSRFDLLAVLRRGEQPAGSTRFLSLRSLFLVIQLTLSLTLLATAATLTRSLWRLASGDPGFDRRRVEFIQMDLSTAGFNAVTGPVFLDQLLDAARNLPALAHVAYTVAIPLDGNGHGFGELLLPEAPESEPSVRTDWNLVSPGYLATLGIPLMQGRDFTVADRAGAPLVGIVNETMARQLWPGRAAVGQVLRNEEGKLVEIIGVARDAKYRSAGEKPRNHFYAPLAQIYFPRVSLIVKTRDDATALPLLRELVRQLRANLPVHHAQTLSAATEAALVPQRIAAGTALGAGLLALLLATTGVYGVTMYCATTRTREFGVRMALGATPRSLLGLALAGSLRLAGLASAMGLAAAAAVGVAVDSLFGGVKIEPAVFGLTALLFLLLVTAAAWFPARRATKADPMVALRTD